MAGAPIMCGSEPVMGALENSTITILPLDLVLINVLSVTMEIQPKVLPKRMFKSLVMFCLIPVSLLSRKNLMSMFKPQVTVTCQHGCSQEGQPQNVPNENIMFGVIKCLSQVITKFDSVFAGSSPNENENVHSPNVPMFSPKSEVIYEKSSSENLSREVSKKEIKKDEQLVPESKNEGNLEVNIVGAKNSICSPETRAYVTDVTDRVSLPATSSKIDSIHPFESDNFKVSLTIKGNSYRALFDTGAAVTAISSQVCDNYLSQKICCLDSSSTSCVTTVNGSPLSVLGKVWLSFVIKLDVFPLSKI